MFVEVYNGTPDGRVYSAGSLTVVKGDNRFSLKMCIFTILVAFLDQRFTTLFLRKTLKIYNNACRKLKLESERNDDINVVLLCFKVTL